MFLCSSSSSVGTQQNDPGVLQPLGVRLTLSGAEIGRYFEEILQLYFLLVCFEQDLISEFIISIVAKILLKTSF